MFTTLAALPDLDLLSFRLGIGYSSPLGHRGLFHSLPFALLFGLVGTWFLFRSARPTLRSGILVFALAVLSAASHGVLDAATTGGQGVAFLAPFSTERIFWSFRPIIASPIALQGFIDRAAKVLLTEAVWVWTPLTLLTLSVQTVRMFRKHSPFARAFPDEDSA